MSKQQVFVNGLRCFKPNDTAPTWIKANLVINKKELNEWLKSQPDEIRVDIKESREKGSWYTSVNDFVPKETKYSTPPPYADGTDPNDDGLPF
jgi:hypothetical protein